MTKMFELTGPAASKDGDAEIEGLRDFTGVSINHESSRIMVTVSEHGDAEDAIFHLDRLGFSQIKG